MGGQSAHGCCTHAMLNTLRDVIQNGRLVYACPHRFNAQRKWPSGARLRTILGASPSKPHEAKVPVPPSEVSSPSERKCQSLQAKRRYVRALASRVCCLCGLRPVWVRVTKGLARVTKGLARFAKGLGHSVQPFVLGLLCMRGN